MRDSHWGWPDRPAPHPPHHRQGARHARQPLGL